jgi:hypothetical protein
VRRASRSTMRCVTDVIVREEHSTRSGGGPIYDAQRRRFALVRMLLLCREAIARTSNTGRNYGRNSTATEWVPMC